MCSGLQSALGARSINLPHPPTAFPPHCVFSDHWTAQSRQAISKIGRPLHFLTTSSNSVRTSLIEPHSPGGHFGNSPAVSSHIRLASSRDTIDAYGLWIGAGQDALGYSRWESGHLEESGSRQLLVYPCGPPRPSPRDRDSPDWSACSNQMKSPQLARTQRDLMSMIRLRYLFKKYAFARLPSTFSFSFAITRFRNAILICISSHHHSTNDIYNHHF